MTSGPVILLCRSCRTLNRVPVAKLGEHPICGRCKTRLGFPTAPISVTTTTFDAEADGWREALLVEFWSETCGYCRAVEPVLRDLAVWRAGRLKILMVDIQREFPLAQRFGVMATPTFILLRNGRQLDRIDGAPREKIDLVHWVDQHL